MSNASQIKKLVSRFKGKPATYITHFLKELGNGDMAAGLISMIEVYEKKIAKVKLRYGFGGVAIGSAGVGIPWLISKRKQESDKQNNKDETEVLSVLKKELELADEEKDLDNLSTEDKDK